MPLKIVRNDITKMTTEAIVNTANEYPAVGPGCDRAVYEAAGLDELLAYRKENIGTVKEGDVFITPGFSLPARYIIHAVSPLFIDGKSGEEVKLRDCYRKSLSLAEENNIRSIAFPLISTGSFGYPKEQGIRIAVDEINAFLLTHEMLIYHVVFDEKATQMGRNLYPYLEAYIDRNYVEEKHEEEYGDLFYDDGESTSFGSSGDLCEASPLPIDAQEARWEQARAARRRRDRLREESSPRADMARPSFGSVSASKKKLSIDEEDAAIEELDRSLQERINHMSDSFSEYLLFLISAKGMKNSEVYDRAIVDKKVFSKIKTNPHYHPQKLTALCLCIGAKLNLDESKDLLSRAGYALSPCDKTDIIFSYFIEKQIYDMVEVDIQLEEHGVPCVIE